MILWNNRAAIDAARKRGGRRFRRNKNLCHICKKPFPSPWDVRKHQLKEHK